MNSLLEKKPVAERYKVAIEKILFNHPDGPFSVGDPEEIPYDHLWLISVGNSNDPVWCNIELTFELLDDYGGEKVDLTKRFPSFLDHFMNEHSRRVSGRKTITLHTDGTIK